jgi:hypothetical protein
MYQVRRRRPPIFQPQPCGNPDNNSILPRDLACGAKYLKRRKKIRGETFYQNQSFSNLPATKKKISG